MKKYLFLLYLIIFGSAIHISAQSQIREKKYKYKTVTVIRHPEQNWQVSVSFFSPFLLHEGIAIQTDYLLNIRNKTVNRLRLFRTLGFHPADRFREKSRYRMLEPGLIWYHQKDFHTGISLNCFLKQRWVRYHGFSYEAALGLGFLWTIYEDKTYVIKSDGSIKEKSFASRIYVAPSASIGFGYDFEKSRKHKNAGAINFQLVTTVPFPMNSSVGFLGYLQLGYRFKISSFTIFMNKITGKKS